MCQAKLFATSRKNPGRRQPFPSSVSNLAGFTLIELLVVIAIIAVLVALLLPVLNKGKLKAQGLQCMSNHKQLTLAWRMYSDDNNDKLLYASGWPPYSSNDPDVWVGGWLNWQDPGNPSNWDINQNITQSPLWPYCGRSGGIWKCPADRSAVTLNGQSLPRVRSMSMNIWVGGFRGVDFGLSGSSDPWAMGGSTWRIYLKMGDMQDPGPTKTFVLLDMREDSIDMGNFGTRMAGWPDNPDLYGFYDLPGYYHHLACGFSFADGHSEIHRWRDPRTMPPLVPNGFVNDSFSSPKNPDVPWLQERATRPNQ